MNTIKEQRLNFSFLYNRILNEQTDKGWVIVGTQDRYKTDYVIERDENGKWHGKYVPTNDPPSTYELMVNDEASKPDLHDRNTYEFQDFSERCVKYVQDGSDKWSEPSEYEKVVNNIFSQFKNTYWDWYFNGLNESAEEKHQWFISQLDTDGDYAILTHVSPVRIEDGGGIYGGTRQDYTPSSDKYRNYFWGSKTHGGDQSESGRYIYKCKVPLSQIYDYPCYNPKGYKSLDDAYENEPFVATWWPNGGGIVVVSRIGAKFYQRIDKEKMN